MRLSKALRRTAVLLALGALWVAASDTVRAQEEPAESVDVPVKHIKMFAENWKWRPNMIRVKAGTKVSIEIENVDSPHRFEMKKLKIRVPLPENETTWVEFIASEPGTYRWHCSRPCGNGCPKMTGKLIVEEAEP